MPEQDLDYRLARSDGLILRRSLKDGTNNFSPDENSDLKMKKKKQHNHQHSKSDIMNTISEFE